MDAKRDWGHAKDYVNGMWLMLQQDKPRDYVLATGITMTVRDFVIMAFKVIGVTLKFEGVGVEEIGRVVSCTDTKYQYLKALQPGGIVVSVEPRYFRPTEVDLLIGDSSKAQRELGWTLDYTVEQLCKEMVEADLVNK